MVKKTKAPTQLCVKVEAGLVARIDGRVRSLTVRLGRTATRADAIRLALLAWVEAEERG